MVGVDNFITGKRENIAHLSGNLKFTFIEHDGVPWHNNAAERAVKAFAYYREVADSMVSEAGLAPYLVLLSIQQTCKYKGLAS